MKQLLILSGKGGTGKTTVAGAFIKLAQAQTFADCDVDAPNLHLISEISRNHKPLIKDFYGLSKAEIDATRCTSCGKCVTNCRFDAITENFQVDTFSCEGCGLCYEICPAGAVSLKPHISGELHLYLSEKKVFSTATLHMGSGNSGLLVTEVKKQMNNHSADVPLSIIDGSPGIGCPVIASLSGTDLVVIVAEPSVSGFSDMERIIKTSRGLGVRIAVCVNKFDLHPEKTEEIKRYCETNKISFVGTIPFDKQAVKAINLGKSIVDFPGTAEQSVKKVFTSVLEELNKKGATIL